MAKSKMKKVREIQEYNKIVIAKYIRVSTDKQREEGYSVEIQRERLESYAKSMYPESQYNVEYREYIDDGFTGATLDRPRMNDLISDVKKGEITHVVVVKLDRLSRSQKDTLYLIEDIFLPNDVAFVSMGESFNTSTPFGRAVIGILSVFAQLERENIYERTRGGMQKRVELGYWPGGGRVPFGYDYDAEQGILVPNKDADIVRKIYDLYLQGYALQHIADVCGLKYEKLAYQIITRKSNTGVVTYNGCEYPGRHEPIVSSETYQRAMTMMLERSGKRYVSTTTHLLTGLVCCGKCGAKMRYQKWGKAGWKFVCYSQQKIKAYLIKDPNCDNPKPWADDVEQAVLGIVFQRAKTKIQQDIENPKTMNVLRELEEQKAELTRKLKRLYNLYVNEDDEVLLGVIQEVKKELQAIDSKVLIEQERSAVTKIAREAQSKLDTLQECWEHMTMSEKQNVMRSVIDKIVVTDDHIHVDFIY